MDVLPFKGTSRSWIVGQQEHHEFHYREMLSPALREEKVQPPGQARGSWLEISSAVKDPGIMVDKLSTIQQCVLAVKKENGICPQHMLVSGVVPVHMEDFVLPPVRFHEVLSAHFSSLTRSVWEAAQPRGVLFLPVTKAGISILKSCQILNLRELKAP